MRVASLKEFLNKNKKDIDNIIGITEESIFLIKSENTCTNCLNKRWNSSFYKDEIEHEKEDPNKYLHLLKHLKNLPKNSFIELKKEKSKYKKIVHYFLCVPDCEKWKKKTD